MAKLKKDKIKIDKTKVLPIEVGIFKPKYPIKFIYNGRYVIIKRSGKIFSVTIDEKNIPITGNSQQLLAESHCQYVSFSNPVQLAKYIIDEVINRRCDFQSTGQNSNQIILPNNF